MKKGEIINGIFRRYDDIYDGEYFHIGQAIRCIDNRKLKLDMFDSI